MKNTKAFAHILILAIVMLLLLVATSSIVIAQQGDETSRTSSADGGDRVVTVLGGPGFISIHPVAFRPLSSDMEWEFINPYSVERSMELFNPSITTDAVYYAPVYLPHGATVTKVVLYYSDYSGLDMLGYLVRRPLSGGTFSDMAVISSSGMGGAGNNTDTTIQYGVVNNQDYAYYAEIELFFGGGSELALVGMRIDYNYPAFLPDVSK